MPLIRYNGQAIEQRKGGDLLGQILNAGCDIQYVCMSGSCGMCRVRVPQGMEHLTSKSGMEGMHGCKEGERLACQAVCKGTGDVVVEQ
jgi:ferredoxin